LITVAASCPLKLLEFSALPSPLKVLLPEAGLGAGSLARQGARPAGVGVDLAAGTQAFGNVHLQGVTDAARLAFT
jgi:hypothetical protein